MNKKRAFSLVEILVSTIVMTMMMVAVIAYIQYGAKIWERGHNSISIENYKRMSIELIKKELMRTNEIKRPEIALPSTDLAYTLPGDTSKYRITASRTTLIRTKNNLLDMHIARNVASFSATRISTWSVEINLQFATEPDEDGNAEIISSDRVVFMAPGAGG